MRKEDYIGLDESIRAVGENLKMHKMAGVIVMVCSVICMAIIAYLAYFPVQVLDIKQCPIIVDVNDQIASKVEPGERLFYKLHYRKYKNLPSTLSMQLINKYQMVFPSFEINFAMTDKEKLKDPDYYDTITIQLDLPETVSGGAHYLMGTLSYRVNPLRTQVYTFTTMSFDIEIEDCNEGREMPVLKIYK